ncbi:MAG: hypothetical protein AAF304_09360, partial [Pseudomonadota bacterium]
MSTIPSTSISDSSESVTKLAAPKKVLKDTYDKVIAALKCNEKLILITGNTSKGKTALLHTICKDISLENRVISLAGKDIPERKDDYNELNAISDFILESTDLNDKLVVTLDDAHLFPVDFLNKLFASNKRNSNNSHGLHFILTGRQNFKDQLLAIDTVNADDLVHCTMDTFTEKDIENFAKNKTYKISSNIKNLNFTADSLKRLAEFIESDKEVLDVILEWCAALAKKDQLIDINPETISRACEFTQQFAGDRNLSLADAYPPSHEVYKFINDLKSIETQNQDLETQSSHFDTESISIDDEKKSATIPTIKQSKELSQDNNQGQVKSKEVSTSTEENSLSINWTPATTKKGNSSKKSLPTVIGVISVLLIGFIVFIASKLHTDTNLDNSNINKVAKESPDRIVVSENFIHEETNSNTKTQKKAKETVLDIQGKEIKKPFVAPLILGEIIEPKLTTNSSEQDIKEVDDETTIDNLLVLAEEQLNNKQLTTPIGANALETYQKILAKEPGNKLAIDGVKKVHDTYMNWAEYYKHNDQEKAERFYSKALEIYPDNNAALAGLNSIQNQISTSIPMAMDNQSDVVKQDAIATDEIQNLLFKADENMSQIEGDIGRNERNYKLFQETQTAYLDVLQLDPQNQHAMQRLSTLVHHYEEWAEQQTEN